MTFTTTKLAGSRYLVEGEDVRGVRGSTVLDGREWEELLRREQVAKAHDDFDRKVEEFFAPIVTAAEELEKAHAVQLDPLMYVVEQNAVEGTEAKEQVLRELSMPTVILRAIDKGYGDRLLWVHDELVLTAAPSAAAGVQAPDVPNAPAGSTSVQPDVPEDSGLLVDSENVAPQV